MDCVWNAIAAIAGSDKRAIAGRWERDHSGRIDLHRIPHRIALAFVTAEEEELVLHDSSADGGAELLQLSWCLGSTNVVEIIARIEPRIAAKSVGATVELVGARLHCHVDDRSRLPPVLRRRIFNDVEFLDRVDGQNRRRISRDTGAIDDALARKRLTVK